MASNAKSRIHRKQSLPPRREFDELLRTQNWEKLLWQPFDANRGAEFFSALAQDRNLEKWIEGFQNPSGSAHKTLQGLIERFFEIIDLAHVPIREPALNERVRMLLATLHDLTLANRRTREVELFRYCIVLRLRSSGTDLLLTILLLRVLGYIRADSSENLIYDHLRQMFATEEGKRISFVIRCKEELDIAVDATEFVWRQLREKKKAYPVIGIALAAFATVMTSSRLQSPLSSSGLVTAPIPCELANYVQVWFERLYSICLGTNVFKDFKSAMETMGVLVRVLPEFWLGHGTQVLPLSNLLEAMWKALLHDNDDNDFAETMMDMTKVLRYLVHPLRMDDSLWSRLESHLKTKIVPGKTVRGTAPAHENDPKYPLLAMLVCKVVKRVGLSRSKDPLLYQVRMELLQNFLFMAKEPAAALLLLDVMTIDNCAVLKQLEDWIDCNDATGSILDEVYPQGRSLSFGNVFFAAYQLRAALNVMEQIMRYASIRQRFGIWREGCQENWEESRIMRIVNWRMAAKASDKAMWGVTVMFHEDLANFDDSLFAKTCGYCVLSIVNCMMLELGPDAIASPQTLALGLCLNFSEEDQGFVKEPVLALLVLARAVKYSPENWHRLQSFSQSNGFRLSAQCLDACLSCTPDVFIHLFEALAVFQYMANAGDDDGNAVGGRTKDRQPIRPISWSLQAVRTILRHKSGIKDHVAELGLFFELLNNYAANKVWIGGIPFAEDDAVMRCCYPRMIEAGEIIVEYLHFAERAFSVEDETTLACFSAVANLTATGDYWVKCILSPGVLKMVSIVQGEMENDARHGEHSLSALITLTTKAIMNSAVAFREKEADTDILINFLLARLRRIRTSGNTSWWDVYVGSFALLALHNLMRNSPNVKSRLFDSGGTEELEAWFSEAQKHDEALLDCVVAVMRTFSRNNPRMISSGEWMYSTRQTRSLKEAALSVADVLRGKAQRNLNVPAS